MAVDFTQKVKNYVRDIPSGEVRTYAEVATACGSPGASRAVGSIMAKNFNSVIPCHRVIRSDGTPGNYNRGGALVKKKKLAAEGVRL